MIERPVLQHERHGQGRAIRRTGKQALPQAYEPPRTTATTPCLMRRAVEASAGTNHRRVVKNFQRKREARRIKGGREDAATLKEAFELRMKADCGNDDLTEAGRLRAQVETFLGFCRKPGFGSAPRLSVAFSSRY